ncbi:hypothetical protein V6K52_03770 [Knoellia sp. S7-12]|uniref:hypothetical protein n=1 Tax=Knoellia sp. S7-12 TaxID=3126698 RepID=UPI003369B48F
MHETTAGQHDGARYEIRIQGHLGSRWATLFEGMALSTDPDGTTVLKGPVVDQAALHGLLSKLRDIGLPLLSVTQLDTETQSPSASPLNTPRATSPTTTNTPQGD